MMPLIISHMQYGVCASGVTNNLLQKYCIPTIQLLYCSLTRNNILLRKINYLVEIAIIDYFINSAFTPKATVEHESEQHIWFSVAVACVVAFPKEDRQEARISNVRGGGGCVCVWCV